MFQRILKPLHETSALRVEYVHKGWGKTACVSKHPGFTVHHLVVLPKKRCSRHLHEHRLNGFFVTSGSMTIREFMNDRDKVTVLNAGDYYEVEPGVEHRFETPKIGCDALEIYFPPPVREDDIVRADVGGNLEE